MDAGRFRADLYYRLGVVSITVPPLRERREDVPDLVASHLEHFRLALGRPVRSVSDEALGLLVDHTWPGNVRELINVVERAVLLAEGDEIRPADLPEGLRNGHGERAPASWGTLPAGGRLTDVPLPRFREQVVDGLERRYLMELLERCQGRIGVAAARAGITPRALYEKLKRHGLRREAYRPDPPLATRGGRGRGPAPQAPVD
jgi:DNA-binding NtrC family response regulator